MTLSKWILSVLVTVATATGLQLTIDHYKALRDFFVVPKDASVQEIFWRFAVAFLAVGVLLVFLGTTIALFSF